MRLLFWVSFSIVVYAYVGYAIVLAIWVRLRPRPVRQGAWTPKVSIVLAARNEEASLPGKIENLLRLDYPPELREIVIASDGSTDRTNVILREQAEDVAAVILGAAKGKANALNAAVRAAKGEILVFLDVRQTVDALAIRELVSPFADPGVGAVSGELLLEAAAGQGAESALGIYWKIEKTVRKLESASGSVVGVTGAIYAIRRELYEEIPVGTILDDVLIPMNVVRRKRRVIFQPSAIARDWIFEKKGKEFSRKVRTLSGNYQLVRLAPWLLSPANPLLFRFVSHKLLRLLVPLLLFLMLVGSALGGGPVYRALFAIQMVFYGLAAVGALRPSTRSFKPIAVANTFTMLNAAAALAFYNFVKRRDNVWV